MVMMMMMMMMMSPTWPPGGFQVGGWVTEVRAFGVESGLRHVAPHLAASWGLLGPSDVHRVSGDF
eukprot:3860952-Karenia_brevis.AAC.1